jgi:hypothetical protein
MSMTPSKSRDEKQMRQADQIAELRDLQGEGIDKLPTVEANRNPKYRVRADEAEKFVFVKTTIKHISTQSKEINLEERIIPIHKAQFQGKVDEMYFATFDIVEVIHDPRSNAPEVYDILHKTGPIKLDTPKQKESSNNVALNEKVQALKKKEADLIAKQTELEEREAALKAKEDELASVEEFRKSAIVHTELTTEEKAKLAPSTLKK